MLVQAIKRTTQTRRLQPRIENNISQTSGQGPGIPEEICWNEGFGKAASRGVVQSRNQHEVIEESPHAARKPLKTKGQGRGLKATTKPPKRPKSTLQEASPTMILEEWHRFYPCALPPVALYYNSIWGEPYRNKGRPSRIIASDGEQYKVSMQRLGWDPRYAAWILHRPGLADSIVKMHNRRGYIMYKVWLGGDCYEDTPAAFKQFDEERPRETAQRLTYDRGASTDLPADSTCSDIPLSTSITEP